jgi:predicted ATPase
VLRRVAIFIGPFTLEAALAVGEVGGIDQSEIEGAVENLVNKSLIVAWPGYRSMLYRLLDTTRSYALEKLAASGEHHSMAACHASYLSQLSERGGIENDASRLRKIPARVRRLRPAVGNLERLRFEE